MIRLEELRLGNYVVVKNKGIEVIGKIFAIGECVSVEGGNNNYDYHLLDPIPLTDNILLKCGYRKVKDSGDIDRFYYQGQVDLSLDFTPSTGNREYDSVKIDCAKAFKYIHELQNYCFALTGEELEVKL